jgi:hypothetical protein
MFPSLRDDEVERVVAGCHAALATVDGASRLSWLKGDVHV